MLGVGLVGVTSLGGGSHSKKVGASWGLLPKWQALMGTDFVAMKSFFRAKPAKSRREWPSSFGVAQRASVVGVNDSGRA